MVSKLRRKQLSVRSGAQTCRPTRTASSSCIQSFRPKSVRIERIVDASLLMRRERPRGSFGTARGDGVRSEVGMHGRYLPEKWAPACGNGVLDRGMRHVSPGPGSNSMRANRCRYMRDLPCYCVQCIYELHLTATTSTTACTSRHSAFELKKPDCLVAP